MLISEDMRYGNHHQLGRYRFQIAALAHILGNKSIDEVLKDIV